MLTHRHTFGLNEMGNCLHARSPIHYCKLYQSALMYMTVDGVWLVKGGEERGREGGEERSRLVVVRCLVSVETGGVEKNQLSLLC